MKHISLTQVLTVVGFLFYSVASAQTAVTPDNCATSLTNLQTAIKDFNDVCGKMGVGPDAVKDKPENEKTNPDPQIDLPCYNQAKACLKEVKEEGISDSNVSQMISMLIPQLSGGASAAGIVKQQQMKNNPYATKVCEKSTMTKENLQSKLKELQRELEQDSKEVSRDRENLTRDVNRVKKDEQEYQEELARLNAKDADAANELAEKMSTAEEKMMKEQIRLQEEKTKLVVQYRQALLKRSQLDRMKTRGVFEMQVRACTQNYLKNDPTRKGFALKDRMALKALCVDDLKAQYNTEVEAHNMSVQMMEDQFKRLSLEESNSQVAAFSRKVQNEQRQTQMNMQAGMKQTQARMRMMDYQNQMLQTQMNAKQRSDQNMMASMTKRMELNQIQSAINNFRSPTAVEPREVISAFNTLQSAVSMGKGETGDTPNCQSLKKQAEAFKIENDSIKNGGAAAANTAPPKKSGTE